MQDELGKTWDGEEGKQSPGLPDLYPFQSKSVNHKNKCLLCLELSVDTIHTK